MITNSNAHRGQKDSANACNKLSVTGNGRTMGNYDMRREKREKREGRGKYQNCGFRNSRTSALRSQVEEVGSGRSE